MSIKSLKFIIGNGGHARVVRDIFKSNKLKVDGFFDDKQCDEKDYIGKIEEISELEDTSELKYTITCAIGSNEVRENIFKQYPNANWKTIIHPFTFISNNVEIDCGTIVCAGSIIQSNVSIGKQCIINTKVSIDHDCIIGNFVHIAPGSTLCGTVKVGEGTFIGAGTVVKNGISIGKNCIIGCGSNVVKDISDNVVAYGNPCKVIKIK